MSHQRKPPNPRRSASSGISAGGSKRGRAGNATTAIAAALADSEP